MNTELSKDSTHSCDKSSCASGVKETKKSTITVEPKWHSYKTDTGYQLEVALPGVAKDKVQVTAIKEGLQIEAEREIETPDSWTIVAGGRLADAFLLKLRLPSDVDVSKLTAKHENGLLSTSLPLKEEAQTRTIEVN